MRSISRAIAIGALALPLTLAGAGFASASAQPMGADAKGGCHKCCCHNEWNWTNIDDHDVSIINAGIIG